VLIAEDDALTAEGLRVNLQALGHEVIGCVESASTIVSQTRLLRPDLLLLDIEMPGGDGLAAVRTLLQEIDLPVVVVSGHSDPEHTEDAVAAGVLAYLVKPVDHRDLRPAIEVALARFRELQALRGEVANLKEALETRKLVERAKGILMRRHKLSEQEAFLRLQRAARDQNRKLGEIAAAVIAADRVL